MRARVSISNNPKPHLSVGSSTESVASIGALNPSPLSAETANTPPSSPRSSPPPALPPQTPPPRSPRSRANHSHRDRAPSSASAAHTPQTSRQSSRSHPADTSPHID